MKPFYQVVLTALFLGASLFGGYAQNDAPPIIAPDLEEAAGSAFSKGTIVEGAIPNKGTLLGAFDIRQGDGDLEITNRDSEGRKALRIMPTAERSVAKSLLPCLVYRGMPQEFPAGCTFMMWVKPDSSWATARSELVSARRSDRGPGLGVSYQPGKGGIDVISGIGEAEEAYGIIHQNSATAIQPDQWTHLAAVYDPEEKVFRLFINGEMTIESQRGLELTAMSPLLSIGAYNGGYAYPFQGEIADIAIYDYVRTPEQIKADATPQ